MAQSVMAQQPMQPPRFAEMGRQMVAGHQGGHVVVQQQPDPFALEQYKQIKVPDVPFGYGGGITESLLNDNEVPEEVRQQYWPIFHKDNVLTFLDPDRKSMKMLSFDIMKIDMLNSIPFTDYTFEKELTFTVLRNVFETKLDRALGFTGQNMKNERIVLQSQFSEQRNINEQGDSANMQTSFFKRLLGRR